MPVKHCNQFDSNVSGAAGEFLRAAESGLHSPGTARDQRDDANQ